MPVAMLLDVTSPAATEIRIYPMTTTRRRIEIVSSPRVGIRRMLKDAAPFPDAGERGEKAAAVVTTLVAPSMLDQARETAPSRAWWMRNDAMWPTVLSGVARFRPWIDVRNSEIGTAILDEECSDHGASVYGTSVVEYGRNNG